MCAAVSEAPHPVAVAVPPPQLAAPTPARSMQEVEGATPLMYACQQNREADLRAIMTKKPAAVREKDRTLKSALHYCAENSSVSCAEAVLSSAPELLDSKDEDGYTTLHLAVIAGNCPLIRLLLARGADVNCLDNERHSVVHWATVCGEVAALEAVLSAGAVASTPDMHGGYPLHYAAQMCGPATEIGVGRLGLAVLRTLLTHDVEVNVTDQDGRQPILWAASAGSADAILALVNAGANVEADDKDGLTALHCAASRGHTDCLETLVSLCGAAVDVMDSNGCTALFYAVTLGHADATQLLLEHGAQPNRQDRKGRTPAHCGAAKGQLETLRILSSRGANMWARNVKGDYPLHEAVSSGRKDLVRWLLAQRPDAINASNNDGRCPLHIAAINNNVEMCKIVLDHESLVNPVMRTSKGGLMTPLDAALYKGNRGCAKYLQLHGGVPANKLTSQSAALRGILQRDPHSDQVNTPDWGGGLAVPDLRGAQSLVQSPVELSGHKHLTVVDGGHTLEVHVEDELLHARRASESSTDDKVRRRRRKRRPKREGSEVETDSSGRQARRRRRRRKDHDDTSDEDSEVERRRRRRKSRRGKGSEGSDSEDTSKRKKKESKQRRKRSVSNDHKKEEVNKENAQEKDSGNEETKSNDGDDSTGSKHNENYTENRRVVKEEITTKEVTKSKKVIEHKEKEKSSSKPTITKTSKTTHEETKTEEQIMTKTSEIVRTPPDSKGDEVSTQDSQDIPTQQVVTAMVHQEETAEQGDVNIESNAAEGGGVAEGDKIEEAGEEQPKNESSNTNDQEMMDQKETENVEIQREDLAENAEGTQETSPDKAKEKEEEKAADDADFWEEGDADGTSAQGKEKEIKNEGAEKEAVHEENDESKQDTAEELKEGDEQENEKVECEAKFEPSSEEADKAQDENKDMEETTIIQKNEPQGEIEDIKNEVDGGGKLEDTELAKDNTEETETKESYGVEDSALTMSAYNVEASGETQVTLEEEHANDNPVEEKPVIEDENDKGLIKVLGRSEVDDENLKGVLEVERISSEALKDRGRVRDREKSRRRTSSSFEIVSPTRSLPDEELDSETPRSRSRTGADSSQLQDSGFEPSPRRDSKKGSSRIPRACRRSQSHSRLDVDSDDERPSLSTVSVTQAVQHSMRKYHLERRIFHELLELKRLQIRAGRSNEALLVKRLVDDYRRAGLCVGLNPYEGVYTFRGFERYLYEQLRLLQSSDRRIIPRLKSTDDLEKLTKALRRTRAGNTLLDNVPVNPMYCTHGTHRCYHATHAYTGVPCAAYIAKINHHTMPKPSSQPSFLPRIDSGKQRVEGQGAEIARCLRYVDPSRPVTLELSHGADRQVISLPTEKLDKNKRYYVTFTIKGAETKSADKERHQHAKSF